MTYDEVFDDLGAELPAPGRTTNIECVANIMNFSAFGALAQIFVIDALYKFSKAVATAAPEELSAMQNGLVMPDAWQGVAREIHAKLEAHLNQQ